MKKVHQVQLTDEERDQLLALTKKGETKARKLRRAQVLLLADKGKTDEEIREVLSASPTMIYRTRQKYAGEGLDAALSEKPRCGGPRKLDAKGEAFLVATACSDAPEGQEHWTMQLLADRLVELKVVETISDETVRLALKKKKLKPWLKEQWCIPTVSAAYVCAMEEVLDVYAAPDDPDEPVICFDEMPRQLLDHVLSPLPMKKGQPERIDYEYERKGTVNLFLNFQPLTGWRHVEVTQRRTKEDFARQMKALVDVHFPDARLIHVVLDNLNTHTFAALYEAFPPEEAQRIKKRLVFHYTPMHGSWLNQAEIELSVLSRQCLKGRIPDRETMKHEVAAWEERRNQAKAKINWLFKVEHARTKLKRLYPS